MTGLKKIIASFTAAAVSLTLTIPVFAAAFHEYDVNHDGSVTLADYTLMAMVLDGYKPLDYNIFDVNDNGVVSFADSATVFDYAWYGSNSSSASVANYGDLRPANANITSVYEGITYLKKNCATGAISEYTLTTAGDTAASTASTEQYTSMEPDPYETAVVRLSSPNNNIIGTGTIVDDHIIATAAHNIYQPGTTVWADIVVEIVGANSAEIVSYTPSYIHLPKDYIYGNGDNVSERSNINDYALIYVEQDLSQYGKFEIGLALDSFVSDNTGTKKVKVSGFPYTQNVGTRYVSEGSIDGNENVYMGVVNPKIMCHNAETAGGDSGGPVYIEETYSLDGDTFNCKTIVGIHLSYYGASRRITADQLYFYRSNTNLN